MTHADADTGPVIVGSGSGAEPGDEPCPVRSLWASLELVAAVLDALPEATTGIENSGLILATNASWKLFAIDNQDEESAVGVGVNYLDTCDRAAGHGCVDAPLAAARIKEVLAGETVQSELEYPCPSPRLDCWFLLRVTPLGGRFGGAILSHVIITQRKRLEDALEHEASHDVLTGLANRVLFNAQLAKALTARDLAGLLAAMWVWCTWIWIALRK